ncbi:MAG: toprim domain-containing protein [Caulobacteraceae bacterium]|nr:toprim domain-containing protein [Caulobacteraceae bacterium]MBX9802011.1 toprim domain-containing protein [Caulobacteraceae bacterium]
MARIPDVEIERLKVEVSLVRLVETSGVRLEKRGKDWVGCCPFHKDDTPSLSVTPDKNLWRCFGCDAGGDVIAWVMRREGVSFRHAVELLREGYAPDATAAPIRTSTVPKLATMTAPAEDAALLDEVVGYYHTTLKQTPDALAYLEGRGLAHPELIETFRLGYADRTLGYRLPQANRKAGAEVRGRLQALGVLRDSGHEHLRGSLVVPILGAQGEIVNLYGRKIGDGLRKGTPDHLYLPGPHRGVFNRAALEASDEIILTEALIDALTFWSAGWRHVTSAYGAGGFTAELLEALETHGIKRVLIAYDRDAAGDRGAASVAEQVAARGMTAFRVQFPKGMDANQYAQAVTPATKSLGALLRSAEWMAGAGRPARRSPEAHPAPAVRDPEGDLPLAAEMETAPVVQDMAEPSVASPVPPGPSAESTVAAEVGDRDVVIRLGDRTWRARGLSRNPSTESLKINLMVRRPVDGGELFHVDGLELLSAKARGAFVAEASAELGLAPEAIKRDLGLVLLKLEAVQEERLEAARAAETKTGPAMTATQENAALAWLKAPDLMGRIAADVASCGVVGEAENALCVYLAALSRKLDRPLAVLIQSTSAAGKSALMDAVMDLIPEEERVAYSAMTGQSLFYLGEADLKHKALAIAEEEGARHAGYALKLLQSQGTLTIASTGKDPATGKLVTQDYTVEGPVALMMTTTAIDLDEELRNRCLVLTIDESREQTRAIHARQRFEETLEGLRGRQDQAAIRTLHQNAQRLIRPLKVVNPFAERLTFLDDQTRTRRDHRKYLGLIRVIALLHQHQRPIRTLARPADGQEGEPVAYIEATVADIAVANRLAHAVLGTTLDELPPQTRRLLALIRTWTEDRATAEAVKPRDLRFTRREVREATGWGDTQLKVHLHRLEELEYLLTRRDGTRLVYELAWGGEGGDGSSFVMGLIDTADLAESGLAQPDQTTNEWRYDGDRAGLEDDRAGSGRPPVGGWSGDGRAAEHASEPRQDGPSSPVAPITPGKPRLGRNGAAVVGATASYAQA